MEAISQVLHPYKDIIGQWCGLVTSAQMLSAVFLLNDIRKRGKTSDDDSIIPFLGGLVLSVIGLRFGVALADDAFIRSNLFGLALNIIYVTIFYYYTPNQRKNSAWRSIGLGGAISAAIIAYAQYERPELVASRLGLILFAIVFVLVGLPFLSLPEIIRKKSVGALPFPLIISGFFVSGSWLVYSFAINNPEMALQNSVLFSMNTIVLSLFVIYPNKAAVKPKKSKKKNN